jgi:hypothetical protein
MKPKTLIPALTSEYLTKNSLFIYSDAITNTETPLRTYIAVKGLETVCKKILSDKQFRESVKEDFLNISGGSIDKNELFGVTVSTVSQIKKNELAKDYIYSDAVQSLQKEIDTMKLQLKSKEDLLKGMKLQEINSGEAQEVLSGFVEVAEADPLKEFDLKITFK